VATRLTASKVIRMEKQNASPATAGLTY
jgi:hypothetical protein